MKKTHKIFKAPLANTLINLLSDCQSRHCWWQGK